jgi:uncharacterized protein (TIGR02271 family)
MGQILKPTGRYELIQREQVLESRGAKVISREGDKIGSIQDIYLDQDTEQPEWALVSTGWFGSRGTFVPLAEADQRGSDIVVPYTSDQVKGAPNMDANGELSQKEEADLYNYYGLNYTERSSDSGLPEGGTGRENGDLTNGYDVSGPTTDNAMTRSEEELRVGTMQRERGRARLKKYVVTENVETTVPVQREEVRLEREPITDANVGRAMDGPDISEEEHEVVVHEEEPVVEKRAVPKERVRLSKDTVTDEAQVSEELRKEQIEQEGDIRR